MENTKKKFSCILDGKGKVAASQFHWWSFRAAAHNQQHSLRGEDLCNLVVALLSSLLKGPEFCFWESNLPFLQLILWLSCFDGNELRWQPVPCSKRDRNVERSQL